MSSKKVVVINYGMSNTLSVSRALKYCGANIESTESLEKIAGADYLILPGVGAFSEGMKALKKRNIIEAIKSFIDKEKPFLGICLGMQMLLEESSEFGVSSGLSIIKGRVEPLPNKGPVGESHKIPHISWNRIDSTDNKDLWRKGILRGVKSGSYVYFVHSFYCQPKDKNNILALTPFYAFLFPSIIKRNNVYGVQFHPEKSGATGLRVLKNFLSL